MKWGQLVGNANSNGMSSTNIYLFRFTVAADEAGGVFRWIRVMIGSQTNTLALRAVLYAEPGVAGTFNLLDWAEFQMTGTDDFLTKEILLPRDVACVAGDYAFGFQPDDSGGQMRVQQAPNQTGTIRFPQNDGPFRQKTSAPAYGSAPPDTITGTSDGTPTMFSTQIESTGPQPAPTVISGRQGA